MAASASLQDNGDANAPVTDVVDRPGACPYTPIFASMTSKQHEVFILIAENRSSKEIATRLGIGESAVNRRIEAVRARANHAPRAALGRAYRRYAEEGIARVLLEQHSQLRTWNAASNAIPGFELDGVIGADGDKFDSDTRLRRSLRLADALLFRVAAIVFIAVGLIVLGHFFLTVARLFSLLP